jgi:hypothetical protein
VTVKASQLAVQPFRLLFELDVPQVDLIDTVDVLGQNLPVGILHYARFIVSSLQVLHDVIEFVHFGMHDAEVADESNFLSVQPAIFHRRLAGGFRIQCITSLYGAATLALQLLRLKRDACEIGSTQLPHCGRSPSPPSSVMTLGGLKTYENRSSGHPWRRMLRNS